MWWNQYASFERKGSAGELKVATENWSERLTSKEGTSLHEVVDDEEEDEKRKTKNG